MGETRRTVTIIADAPTHAWTANGVEWMVVETDFGYMYLDMTNKVPWIPLDVPRLNTFTERSVDRFARLLPGHGVGSTTMPLHLAENAVARAASEWHSGTVTSGTEEWTRTAADAVEGVWFNPVLKYSTSEPPDTLFGPHEPSGENYRFRFQIAYGLSVAPREAPVFSDRMFEGGGGLVAFEE